jgi:hypothetical protein
MALAADTSLRAMTAGLREPGGLARQGRREPRSARTAVAYPYTPTERGMLQDKRTRAPIGSAGQVVEKLALAKQL